MIREPGQRSRASAQNLRDESSRRGGKGFNEWLGQTADSENRSGSSDHGLFRERRGDASRPEYSWCADRTSRAAESGTPFKARIRFRRRFDHRAMRGGSQPSAEEHCQTGSHRLQLRPSFRRSCGIFPKRSQTDRGLDRHGSIAQWQRRSANTGERVSAGPPRSTPRIP